MWSVSQQTPHRVKEVPRVRLCTAEEVRLAAGQLRGRWSTNRSGTTSPLVAVLRVIRRTAHGTARDPAVRATDPPPRNHHRQRVTPALITGRVSEAGPAYTYARYTQMMPPDMVAAAASRPRLLMLEPGGSPTRQHPAVYRWGDCGAVICVTECRRSS